VFTVGIHSSHVPAKYRPPPTSRSTESDAFIIHNLPLYLADSARTWLEHLPSDRIACWEDLKEIFVGNF